MNKIKVTPNITKLYSTTATWPKTCDSFCPYFERKDELNSTFEFSDLYV